MGDRLAWAARSFGIGADRRERRSGRALGFARRLDDVERADAQAVLLWLDGRCDGSLAENAPGCVRWIVPIWASSAPPPASAAGSSLVCADSALATLRERGRHATMSKVSCPVLHPSCHWRAWLLNLEGDRHADAPACGASLERDAILVAADVVSRVAHDREGTVLRWRSGIWRSRVCREASGSLRSALSSKRKRARRGQHRRNSYVPDVTRQATNE